ncbi:MAG TPA: PIN domain-containing protein [Solirubrobacteraceae bacterium]|nr:PIN domain-containing protein [Solirubrobacteraceae bacterium]
MIVLDTSVVLAFMDRKDANHERVRDWIAGNNEELVSTPLVLAELDHLVQRFGGPLAAKALREDFDSGAYQVAWWTAALHETIALARAHEAMGLGLTDASLLALAAHAEGRQIATLDERHFRRVRDPSGEAFRLLPADGG